MVTASGTCARDAPLRELGPGYPPFEVLGVKRAAIDCARITWAAPGEARTGSYYAPHELGRDEVSGFTACRV